MTTPLVCRDCGTPLDHEPHGTLVMVTCRNKACTLWSVTQTTDSYDQVPLEQWESYRTVVRGLKRRMGIEVES